MNRTPESLAGFNADNWGLAAAGARYTLRELGEAQADHPHAVPINGSFLPTAFLGPRGPMSGG